MSITQPPQNLVQGVLQRDEVIAKSNQDSKRCQQLV